MQEKTGRGDKTTGKCRRVKEVCIRADRERRDKELTGYLQTLPSVQGRETILD